MADDSITVINICRNILENKKRKFSRRLLTLMDIGERNGHRADGRRDDGRETNGQEEHQNDPHFSRLFTTAGGEFVFMIFF